MSWTPPAVNGATHTVFGDNTWQTHEVLFEHNIPVVEHPGGGLPLRVLARPLE